VGKVKLNVNIKKMALLLKTRKTENSQPIYEKTSQKRSKQDVHKPIENPLKYRKKIEKIKRDKWFWNIPRTMEL
jgi:hypothetical protein